MEGRTLGKDSHAAACPARRLRRSQCLEFLLEASPRATCGCDLCVLTVTRQPVALLPLPPGTSHTSGDPLNVPTLSRTTLAWAASTSPLHSPGLPHAHVA